MIIKTKDATNGEVIPGVNITWWTKSIAGYESPLKEGQTRDDGVLELGHFSPDTEIFINVDKPSYDPTSSHLKVVGDAHLTIPMNPQSPDGRIILTWETDIPSDLDIHLRSNHGCDIFYFRPKCDGNSLDLDNTVSTLVYGI